MNRSNGLVLQFALLISLIWAVPIDLDQYQQLPGSVVIAFNGNRVAGAVPDVSGIRVLDIGYGRPANGSKNSVSVDEDAIVIAVPLVADGEQPIMAIGEAQMSRDSFNQRQHASIKAATMVMVVEVPITVARTVVHDEVLTGSSIQSTDSMGILETPSLPTLHTSGGSDVLQINGITVGTTAGAATSTGSGIESSSGIPIGDITESLIGVTVGSSTGSINFIEKSAPLTASPISMASNTISTATNGFNGVIPEIEPSFSSGTILGENSQMPHIQYGISTIPQSSDVISTIPSTISASTVNPPLVPSPSASLISINALFGTTSLPHEAIAATINADRMHANVIPEPMLTSGTP